MITIDRIDHLVLTVANIDVTVKFYESVLGMKAETFGEGRVILITILLKCLNTSRS